MVNIGIIALVFALLTRYRRQTQQFLRENDPDLLTGGPSHLSKIEPHHERIILQQRNEIGVLTLFLQKGQPKRLPLLETEDSRRKTKGGLMRILPRMNYRLRLRNLLPRKDADALR